MRVGYFVLTALAIQLAAPVAAQQNLLRSAQQTELPLSSQIQMYESIAKVLGNELDVLEKRARGSELAALKARFFEPLQHQGSELRFKGGVQVPAVCKPACKEAWTSLAKIYEGNGDGTESDKVMAADKAWQALSTNCYATGECWAKIEAEIFNKDTLVPAGANSGGNKWSDSLRNIGPSDPLHDYYTKMCASLSMTKRNLIFGNNKAKENAGGFSEAVQAITGADKQKSAGFLEGLETAVSKQGVPECLLCAAMGPCEVEFKSITGGCSCHLLPVSARPDRVLFSGYVKAIGKAGGKPAEIYNDPQICKRKSKRLLKMGANEDECVGTDKANKDCLWSGTEGWLNSWFKFNNQCLGSPSQSECSKFSVTRDKLYLLVSTPDPTMAGHYYHCLERGCIWAENLDGGFDCQQPPTPRYVDGVPSSDSKLEHTPNYNNYNPASTEEASDPEDEARETEDEETDQDKDVPPVAQPSAPPPEGHDETREVEDDTREVEDDTTAGNDQEEGAKTKSTDLTNGEEDEGQ